MRTALTILGSILAGTAGAADLKPAATAAALPPAPPSFFLFADTQVSYYYEATAREPGIPATKGNPLNGREIPKNVLNISHANAWAYGTNFFTIDILKSGSQDPGGTGIPNLVTFNSGAVEAYGLYRGTLSGNALTGTKVFMLPGIVKDVSLAYGFDLSTKNTSFGPETRKALAGLSFAFDVPAGFLNLGIYVQKEYNRNGFVAEPFRSVEYNAVPHFEVVYNLPLAFTGLPLSLAGFNNVNLAKGKDGFGAETKTEFMSRTNLVLDLGKLIYDQPNRLDVFVGFQYWLNKFGANSRTVPGAEEKTFLAGVSVHVF